MPASAAFDAVLVVSFGGPEKPADVMPFLENVTRGRAVPRPRLLAVAEHYYLLGGVSPINAQTRAIAEELRQELDRSGPHLPVYIGNRNWHPFLADTLRTMAGDGVRRALAFVTSGFGSYSSCRQYREDIARAQAEVGGGAPQIEKLRLFYNHPDFITMQSERAAAALQEAEDAAPAMLFTAHSIPLAQAATAPYVRQLNEAARLISAALGRGPDPVVYQSRSGDPREPWLEPLLDDALRQTRAAGASTVVLVPLGFLSDHMEVVYDLDTEAKALGASLGLRTVRAPTIADHPAFGAFVRQLIVERVEGLPLRPAAGAAGAWPDECPDGCCLVAAARSGGPAGSRP